MSWDLTGKKVVADYNGRRVTGTVESSRTTYGVDVKHYVVLNPPLHFHGELLTRLAVRDQHILVAI